MEKYQVIQPSALLAPYVKQYWFLETDNVTGASQRIIPNGSVCMIFHRGDRMFSLAENTLQPRSFVCGQSAGYSDLVQTGKIDMICVAFQPHGVKAFFRLPANELNGQTISVDALGDSGLNELKKRILNLYDHTTCVQLLESFLLKRLYLSKEYNYKRMAAVVQSINCGQTDIAGLARISCLGYKQFKRVFAEYVGANPNEFLRVVRFQRALYTLQNQTDMNFTRLAFECGYYDQPHLIREFKIFSGYTPSEYVSVCAPYSDYFS